MSGAHGNTTVRMVLTSLFDWRQAIEKDGKIRPNKESKLEWLQDPLVSHIPTQVYVVDQQASGYHSTFNNARNFYPDLYNRHLKDPKAAPIRFVPLMNGFGAQECNGYLSYIITYYHHLPDVSIFLHGKPAEHNKDILKHINAVLKHWEVQDIGFLHLNTQILLPRNSMQKRNGNQFWPLWGFLPKSIPQSLEVQCCAQFMVTRERIHIRPLWFYENLLELVYETGNCAFPEIAWHIAFGESAVIDKSRSVGSYSLTDKNIETPKEPAHLKKIYLSTPLGKVQRSMLKSFFSNGGNSGFVDQLSKLEIEQILNEDAKFGHQG